MSILSRLLGKSSGDSQMSLSAFWERFGFALKPGRSDAWTDYSDRAAESAYRLNALVYACVREVSTSFSEPMLKVWRTTDEEFLDSHETTQLLNRPNPQHTGTYLQTVTVSRLLLTGRAFVWLWRTDAGRAAQLWPIPTSWVSETLYDATGLPATYVLQVDGKRWHVPATDMVVASLPDPATMHGSVGCLEAALHDFDTDSERQRYVHEMLTNVVVPGVSIRANGALSPRDRDTLREALTAQAGRGS